MSEGEEMRRATLQRELLALVNEGMAMIAAELGITVEPTFSPEMIENYTSKTDASADLRILDHLSKAAALVPHDHPALAEILAKTQRIALELIQEGDASRA